MQVGFWSYLKDLLLWVPKKLWELLLEGLASVINAIPVPDFIANLGSFFDAIPSGVAYFLGPLQIGTGVTFMVTAYVIRFCIRRIPVIG